MSFISNLENEIAKVTGYHPCSSDDSNFYYEVASATKTGCCISVDVNLFLKGCLNDIFIRICQLKTRLDWSFSVSPDNDDEYIATLTLFQITVECCKDSKESKGIISDCETTIVHP